MKTLALFYTAFALVVLNMVIVPKMISADDTLLTVAGILVILTQVGLAVNFISNKFKGEKQ